MARKDFAAMEATSASGDSAARAALRSRMAHPTRLRLDEVQPNPRNPRYDEDDPEVVELADTLTRVGQLQSALVMTREQYLHAFPDEHDRLGPQPWVVIVGNRRLAASRLADRPALDVRVAGELDTAEDVEDRILIENIHRKGLPPLLEAEHLQRRLARPGQTIRSVGEAIGKSHTYVQQRLDLLRLIPEFQQRLRTGTINIRTGRRLGALPPDQQHARLAAGPPFVPETPAPRTNGDTPEPDPGNPVSTGDSPDRSDQVARGAAPAPGSDDGAADGRERHEHRQRPAPTAPTNTESARAAVTQWLDSALAELDRVLPAVGDGDDLGRSLADARRHIEQAQAALHPDAAAAAR